MSDWTAPWALRSLPIFPALGVEALSLVDDPDASAADIAEVVRRDPSIAARTMTLANSPRFPGGRVSDLQAAVVRIGTGNVKRIVVNLVLGDFLSFAKFENEMLACWGHSVACAVSSESLARCVGVSSGEAYTAGLLHNIGRLALLGTHPDEYAAMLRTMRERHDYDAVGCERALFDVDHRSAGAWLAEKWGFPTRLRAAISRYFNPGGEDGDLSSVVGSGCRLAEALGYDPLGGESTMPVQTALQALPPETIQKVLADEESLREQIDYMLRISTPRGAAKVQ